MFEWKKYRFSENGQVPPFSCDATQLIKGFRRSPELTEKIAGVKLQFFRERING